MPRPAASSPVPPPFTALWTQSQTAQYLGVSVRYLRDSSCPKVLLPGHGSRGQSLVRYNPLDIVEWARRWGTNRGGNG